MITFEAGRTRTWRLPRFSALKMLRRQSLSTETRTMTPARRKAGSGGRQLSHSSGQVALRACCAEQGATRRERESCSRVLLPRNSDEVLCGTFLWKHSLWKSFFALSFSGKATTATRTQADARSALTLTIATSRFSHHRRRKQVFLPKRSSSATRWLLLSSSCARRGRRSC